MARDKDDRLRLAFFLGGVLLLCAWRSGDDAGSPPPVQRQRTNGALPTSIDLHTTLGSVRLDCLPQAPAVVAYVAQAVRSGALRGALCHGWYDQFLFCAAEPPLVAPLDLYDSFAVPATSWLPPEPYRVSLLLGDGRLTLAVHAEDNSLVVAPDTLGAVWTFAAVSPHSYWFLTNMLDQIARAPSSDNATFAHPRPFPQPIQIVDIQLN